MRLSDLGCGDLWGETGRGELAARSGTMESYISSLGPVRSTSEVNGPTIETVRRTRVPKAMKWIDEEGADEDEEEGGKRWGEQR